MNRLKEKMLDLSCLLAIPLVGSLYPLLNNSNNGAKSLVTEVDILVPFIPEFIVPYVLWYPFVFICMVYFCYKDKRVYYRTLGSILLGMLVSYGIFFVFQTHVPRPVLEGNDIFTRMVAILYSGDNPYNCFPSLHVLESYLMMKGINACSEKNKFAVISINFTGILIIISTQYIKQHVILDAVGGIYLGEVIFNTLPSFARVLSLAFKRKVRYTTNL